MSRLTIAAIAAGCLLSVSAHAEIVKLHGTFSSAAEVPPHNTAGAGTCDVTVDTATNKVTYNLVYTGLTGPATMAHIHGPALAGANAGVMVPFSSPASPIKGEATVTAPQAADMVAGKTYGNVHTAANPGGEIRCQLTK
jgi:hypothetical protein